MRWDRRQPSQVWVTLSQKLDKRLSFIKLMGLIWTSYIKVESNKIFCYNFYREVVFVRYLCETQERWERMQNRNIQIQSNFITITANIFIYLQFHRNECTYCVSRSFKIVKSGPTKTRGRTLMGLMYNLLQTAEKGQNCKRK